MIGQTVGNWMLTHELGPRPMGTAFQARAGDGTDREATVTLLTHEATRTREFLTSFPADMLGLHRLKHPNLVAFLEAGVAHGQAWYAMDAIHGVDCESILKKPRKAGKEPGLSWHNDVLGVAIQAARALKHAHHRSILHRDLRPANFLLTREGLLKIADCGVAKFFDLSPLTLPADSFGTIGFLAPEHFNGKPLTRRTDLYALGGVLYTLVTGRPPFTAATTAEFLHKHCYSLPDRPSRFVPDIATELDDLICDLLSKDPARRPATAGNVIERLDEIRARLERKGRKIAWPPDPGDASEPMPALQEEEPPSSLDMPEPPRALLARPWVVVPSLLFVIGLMVALVMRPRPSAEELYTQAIPLIESKNPEDWQTAWQDYLEPLSTRYPDEYKDEIQAVRQKMRDRRELENSIELGQKTAYPSESERLYAQGVALLRNGDRPAAKRVWEHLIVAFEAIPDQARGVALAKEALNLLARNPGNRQPTTMNSNLTGILDEIRRRKGTGRENLTQPRLEALEALYANDPEALQLIRELR